MADYFSLGNVIPVSIITDDDNSHPISVCGTPLRTGRFNGAWFTNFPLSLRADDTNATWIMTVSHEDGNTDTYTYNTMEIQPNLTACTPGDSVTFTLSNATMIEILSVNEGKTVENIYDLTGKRIPAMQRGVNIILYSDGTRKKVFMK